MKVFVKMAYELVSTDKVKNKRKKMMLVMMMILESWTHKYNHTIFFSFLFLCCSSAFASLDNNSNFLVSFSNPSFFFSSPHNTQRKEKESHLSVLLHLKLLPLFSDQFYENNFFFADTMS